MDGLNLSIRKGEIILILGENGSGKTTLLRTLARRHFGSIMVETGEIALLEGTEVSLIAQRPNTQILTHSVKEELATPFSFRRMPREKRKKLVSKTLAKFGLEHLSEDNPEHLSTGQKQMVNCATVGQMGSQVLLMDEPFAILDDYNSELILGMIDHLKREGSSVVIVEQRFPKKLKDLVDKVYKIEQGKLRRVGGNDLVQNDFSEVFHNTDHVSKRPLQFNLDLEIGRSKKITDLHLVGEYHTIVLEGRNGVGKTTTLLTLFGSLPAFSGNLNQQISEAYKIYVPQDPIAFFRKPTLEEELKFRGIETTLFPEDWLRKPIFALSEGQKKWASLQIAFGSQAELLLLDEPTFALDSYNRKRFYKMLIETPKVVIIATHDEHLREWATDSKAGKVLIKLRKVEDNQEPSRKEKERKEGHVLPVFLFMFLTVFVIAQNSIWEIGALLGISILFFLRSGGIKSYLSMLWNLRYFLTLSLVLHAFLSWRYVSVNTELTFFLRMLLLFTAMNLIGSNMNPDEMTDLLMKIGMPPTLAWVFGTSLRQTRFFISEMQIFKEVHQAALILNRSKIMDQAVFAVDLLVASYNLAIDRSAHMTDSLLNRGWSGPHRTIICYSHPPSQRDLLLSFGIILLMGLSAMY